MAEQIPKLKVIGAHLGGWSIYEEAAKQLAGFENLRFDCSSTFYWLEHRRARDLIRMLGTDRVMFGSDFPMWTPKTELKTPLELGFTNSELERLLSKTFFGL